MDIINISKNEKEATVKLSSDELVKLGNVLYNASEEDKNDLYYQLYSDVMLARDLSQYGHVDGFCFSRIAECRRKLKNQAVNMQGTIKLNQIPEACRDCEFHSYASGCRVKRKVFEGFKAARPDWCPIIKTNEGSENDV